MNPYYTNDFSLFDFALSDPTVFDDSLSRLSPFSSDHRTPMRARSPPKHRHDGTSPLPLGMDWSPPPLNWDGWHSVWPHDHHTGWSYCVTLPSWLIGRNGSGSDPMVFYRVQVGIQSPQGITTTRAVLRRFNEFLDLLSELKKVFSNKNLPPAPSKSLLRIKTRTFLEERRHCLEEWMKKLLCDIDVSRSAPVAIFLELEAAARSYFEDTNQISDANFISQSQQKSDISVIAASSSAVSDFDYCSAHEKSKAGTPRAERDGSDPTKTKVDFGMANNDSGLVMGDSVMENQRSYLHNMQVKRENSAAGRENGNKSTSKAVLLENDTEVLSKIEGDLPEGCEAARIMDSFATLSFEFPSELVVAFPPDEQHKMNRALWTTQRRLVTAKSDVEDLIAKFNQELALRQYLATKVTDLEVEVETTRQNCKDNLQQAILTERERYTQMQWDVEEYRRKLLVVELKLKDEQEERAQLESNKVSMIQENQALRQELEVTREQLINLHKSYEQLEQKSKGDVKLLVKEVKSLRTSCSELKQEMGRLIKEKSEVEEILEREKERKELVRNANAKLLRELEILRNRLIECSVHFLIDEEDKLIIDESLPSDAINLLTTSNNRIGLLLAEAQLLAQDVESFVSGVDRNDILGTVDTRVTDDQMKKMLTDMFIDNATSMMRVNSVLRCALNAPAIFKSDDEDEVPLRQTVMSKFLER